MARMGFTFIVIIKKTTLPKYLMEKAPLGTSLLKKGVAHAFGFDFIQII